MEGGLGVVGGKMSHKDVPDPLAPYDYHRQPRALKHGKIQVSVEAIKGDLSCPICLSILQNTSMTLECSHRFCKSCIETSLRTNSNDCPTCREKVVTRRSLRDDSRFNNLISALFGDTSLFEQKEEEMLRTLRSVDNSAQIRLQEKQALNARMIEEEETRTKRRAASSSKLNPLDGDGDSTKTKKKKVASSPFLTNDDYMLFVLRKHPLEQLPSATKKEYIKAPQKLTVANMRQFLLQQYQSNNINSVATSKRLKVVYHDSNGEEHQLEDSDSLEDIANRFKKGDKVADLVLHYKIRA